MTVDAVGILAAVVLGTIFTLLIIYLFAAPRWDVTSQTVPALLICALSPLAWYAMCSALTSSLKRGWRFLPGLAWPVALIIPLLTTIGTDPDSNPLFKGIHVIATAINYFNPLLYSLISTTNGVLHMNAPLGTPILSAVALLVLIVLYIGASLLQWRRVEA
jgi:hypothetical protein